MPSVDGDKVFRLPDGALAVPVRADGADGLIGDGLMRLLPGSAESQQWENYLVRSNQEAIPAPVALMRMFAEQGDDDWWDWSWLRRLRNRHQ